MSIRMDSNFSTVANIREGMDLCADQNNSPFQVRLVPETINNTYLGTAPYRLHASTYKPGAAGGVCNLFRMNMTGSSFIWTPQLLNNTDFTVEGDSSNLTVFMQSGGSIAWVATEMEGSNTAFVGGNYTFMTQEMLDEAEKEDQGNGGMSMKPVSLKTILVASMVVMGLLVL